MLVPIYLPTGTTTRKRFIFANIYNDTLVILTTATFVYVCIYIYPYICLPRKEYSAYREEEF